MYVFRRSQSNIFSGFFGVHAWSACILRAVCCGPSRVRASGGSGEREWAGEVRCPKTERRRVRRVCDKSLGDVVIIDQQPTLVPSVTIKSRSPIFVPDRDALPAAPDNDDDDDDDEGPTAGCAPSVLIRELGMA